MTVRPDVPDYARPSIDVERRADTEWQWGVTHSLRTAKLAPIFPDVEYSITVKVQRMAMEVDPDTIFAGLGRTSHLNRWRQMPRRRSRRRGRASLGHVPRLAHRASREQLTCVRHRYDGTDAAYRGPDTTARGAGAHDTRTDDGRRRDDRRDAAPISTTCDGGIRGFDHRNPATGGAPLFTYSYGERVAVDTVDSFERFVRRAENNARAHQALFDMPGTSAKPDPIGHQSGTWPTTL